MKRKAAVIASVILAGSMAVITCACSLFDGYSADSSFPYDGAVANGYTGNEVSYMASLDTPSTRERRLYEEAVASGAFEGSYLDFLRKLNSADADDTASVGEAFTSVVCVTASFGFMASSGAGVIWSIDKAAGDAYIVTNYHVIYNSRLSSNISVCLYGERVSARAISATYFGGAMNYDIAILKVTDSDVLKESSATAATIGNSESLTVGERVYAIGNPNGDGFSVTGGIVSVTAENIEIERADGGANVSLPEIRTDAAVNHGNSGGGLFNAAGELVGIVNARTEYSEDGVTVINGFGYALPVSFVSPLAQNIFDNRGKAVVARLGITAAVEDSKGVYDETNAKYYIQEKIVVNSLESTGAGAMAKLRRGDTLVSATLNKAAGGVKTVQITRLNVLTNLLLEVRSGDTLTLQYSRDDEFATVTINFNQSRYFNTVS